MTCLMGRRPVLPALLLSPLLGSCDPASTAEEPAESDASPSTPAAPASAREDAGPGGHEEVAPAGPAAAAAPGARSQDPAEPTSTVDAPDPVVAPRLPLPLCDKYFPDETPVPVFFEVVTTFAASGCQSADSFSDQEIAAFFNDLHAWALEAVGCEALLASDKPASRFALYPENRGPLALADIELLIDSFLHALTMHVPLEAADVTDLRAALEQAGRAAMCEACAPKLERCAMDGVSHAP